MKKGIAKLASDLISLKTVSNDTESQKNGIKFIVNWLKKTNLKHKIFESSSIPSLLIFPKLSAKFDIILHGHLDVVPGLDRQFKAKVVGDKLFGRGALDMKGSLAVMLLLAQGNFSNKNHAILITSDEEIGGANGADYLTKNNLVDTDYFLTGEPTNFQLATEEKGVLWCVG